MNSYTCQSCISCVSAFAWFVLPFSCHLPFYYLYFFVFWGIFLPPFLIFFFYVTLKKVTLLCNTWTKNRLQDIWGESNPCHQSCGKHSHSSIHRCCCNADPDGKLIIHRCVRVLPNCDWCALNNTVYACRSTADTIQTLRWHIATSVTLSTTDWLVIKTFRGTWGSLLGQSGLYLFWVYPSGLHGQL